MARPIKNNADYFSHDASMRNDPKIKYIRTKYGMVGYGLYCMLLEYLTNSEFFECGYSDMDKCLMAGDFGVEINFLENFVNECEKLGLFIQKNGKIFSGGLKKRLKSVQEKRVNARKSNGSNNRVSVTETPVSEEITEFLPQSAESKQQKKVKEIKKEKIKKESVFDFGKFWEIFPKKTKESEARMCFANLTETEKVEILRILPIWCSYWKTIEPYLIPNPWDWLLKKGWRKQIPAKYGNYVPQYIEKPKKPIIQAENDDKKLDDERDERERILQFYQNNLDENKKRTAEEFLSTKFAGLPVKKGDFLYNYELAKFVKNNFLINKS